MDRLDDAIAAFQVQSAHQTRRSGYAGAVFRNVAPGWQIPGIAGRGPTRARRRIPIMDSCKFRRYAPSLLCSVPGKPSQQLRRQQRSTPKIPTLQPSSRRCLNMPASRRKPRGHGMTCSCVMPMTRAPLPDWLHWKATNYPLICSLEPNGPPPMIVTAPQIEGPCTKLWATGRTASAILPPPWRIFKSTNLLRAAELKAQGISFDPLSLRTTVDRQILGLRSRRDGSIAVARLTDAGADIHCWHAKVGNFAVRTDSSSHAAVAGAGELNDIQAIARVFIAGRESANPIPNAFCCWTRLFRQKWRSVSRAPSRCLADRKPHRRQASDQFPPSRPDRRPVSPGGDRP